MKGRPIAPAMMRFVITTFEYSYALTLPSRIACSTTGPKRKKPTSSFETQPRADEQRGGDPGELRAEPEVLLLLADDLADEGGGAALEVVALVDEVVAVGDELRDRVLLGHDLGDHRAVLVVAHVLAVAVGVDLEVVALPLGEDLYRIHGQCYNTKEGPHPSDRYER